MQHKNATEADGLSEMAKEREKEGSIVLSEMTKISHLVKAARPGSASGSPSQSFSGSSNTSYPAFDTFFLNEGVPLGQGIRI